MFRNNEAIAGRGFGGTALVNAVVKSRLHRVVVPSLLLVEYSKGIDEPFQIVEARDHICLPIAVCCEAGFQAGISETGFLQPLLPRPQEACGYGAEWF
jgi:hypothetical protein